MLDEMVERIEPPPAATVFMSSCGVEMVIEPEPVLELELELGGASCEEERESAERRAERHIERCAQAW